MENEKLLQQDSIEDAPQMKENKEINYGELSVDDMIYLLGLLEKYEDEDGEIKEIPDFIRGGEFDKELFAALLLFKAPQYLLGSSETAPEQIVFLKGLNRKLNNPVLENTISYLESQLPYLSAAKKVSDNVFTESNAVFNTTPTTDDVFNDLNKKADSLVKTASALLLKTQAGVLFANQINEVYRSLQEEYLGEKDPSKQIENK